MTRPDSIDRRHLRFTEQAAWTADLRRRLLGRIPDAEGALLLEVGAGTGAVAVGLTTERRAGRVLALDFDLAACRFGAEVAALALWQCGDAHALPFLTSSLDAAFFHYVLLWLDDPAQALAEAVRVTRSGGWVAALAEPDHAARLDFPDVLARLGERQTEALAMQGADVRMGRKLRALFAAVELDDVECGVLGGEWMSGAAVSEPSFEWETLRNDLELTVPAADLDALEAFDRESWDRRERILFVPTFYAIGRVR
jgi:SAM-dependent methyltransferase